MKVGEKTDTTVIEAKRGWVVLDLAEILRYRDLIYFLVWRDIKVRYKQTVLGVAWAVIQPFMTMVVFSIIFGHWVKMPSEGYPYPLFVYSALLPWTFFANAITTSGGSVVGSSNLITKVYFPRLIIPMASIGAGIVDFLISFAVMLGMMVYYQVSWHASLVAVPFLFLAVMFTALGVGTFLSALIVAYRDFRYLIPFMMQLWMYLTPVIYSPTLFPEKWRWIFNLNPMVGLIGGFRSAFLGQAFDKTGFLMSFAVSILIFFAGVCYFKQVERGFADVI